MILTDTEAVRLGRLFRLKLERSAASREAALDTICPVPGGYVVRIGGRMRGRVERFGTRRQAEAAVKAHYDAALLQFVRREGAKR